MSSSSSDDENVGPMPIWDDVDQVDYEFVKTGIKYHHLSSGGIQSDLINF